MAEHPGTRARHLVRPSKVSYITRMRYPMALDPKVMLTTKTEVIIKLTDRTYVFSETEARSVLTQLTELFDYRPVLTCACNKAPHGPCPNACPDTCCSPVRDYTR